MRLLAENDHKVITKNKENNTQFSMADKNLFIGMYRDTIYKNKLRVIPQEYMANARDAHREVGLEHKPIEVTLPTVFDPMLVVKDYGPGIGEERSAIFSQYGASTKRLNDDENGGFGIGCKCAWSYTESFTIDTVYEQGNKKINRVYSLYITHQLDPGNIRVMSEAEVDNDTPTGTTIYIPIIPGDIELIAKSVYTVCAFWDIKPLIKPEENEHNVVIDKEFGGDNWKLLETVDLFGIDGNSFVVVDGICYNIDLSILHEGKSQYEEVGNDGEVKEVRYGIDKKIKSLLQNNKLALFFDVNDVRVAPNRESLDYNVHTIQSINNLAEEIYKNIENKLNKIVKDPNNNYFDVICKVKKLSIHIDDLYWSYKENFEIDVFDAIKDTNNCMATVVYSDGSVCSYYSLCWVSKIDFDKTAFLVYKTNNGTERAASSLKGHPQTIKDMGVEYVVFFYQNGYCGVSRKNVAPLITHKRIRKTTNRSAHPTNGIFDHRGSQIRSIGDISDDALFIRKRYQDYLIGSISVNPLKLNEIFSDNTIYAVSVAGEKNLRAAEYDIKYAENYLVNYLRLYVANNDEIYYRDCWRMTYNYQNEISKYGDLMLEWAKRENKRRIFLAIKITIGIISREKLVDTASDLAIKLCKYYNVEIPRFESKYIHIIKSKLSSIPFFSIYATEDIMRNIIKSYKEIDQ